MTLNEDIIMSQQAWVTTNGAWTDNPYPPNPHDCPLLSRDMLPFIECALVDIQAQGREQFKLSTESCAQYIFCFK